MTPSQFHDKLSAAITAAGSQKAWAAANKVSASYVNDVLLKRKEPGDAILRAMGLERVVTYRKASA